MQSEWMRSVFSLAAAAMIVAAAAFAGEADGQGAAGAAGAQEPVEPKLKVGDPAPEFSVPKPGRPEGSDEMLKLSDFKGEKNVLLAFYPRVFTGGCTRQMCGYRDEFQVFQDNDTEIMALSHDPQAESDRFKAEHQLPFLVIGDASKSLAEAIGVGIRERGETATFSRSVVLVDKQGVIQYIDMEYGLGNDDDKNALFAKMQELKAAEAAAGEAGAAAAKTEG